MDERPLGLADGVLDDVDEGGHVVVGHPLALGHGGHQVGRDLGGAGPDGGGRRRRDLARPRPGPRRPAAPPRATSRSRASSVKRAAISGSE